MKAHPAKEFSKPFLTAGTGVCEKGKLDEQQVRQRLKSPMALWILAKPLVLTVRVESHQKSQAPFTFCLNPSGC